MLGTVSNGSKNFSSNPANYGQFASDSINVLGLTVLGAGTAKATADRYSLWSYENEIKQFYHLTDGLTDQQLSDMTGLDGSVKLVDKIPPKLLAPKTHEGLSDFLANFDTEEIDKDLLIKPRGNELTSEWIDSTASTIATYLNPPIEDKDMIDPASGEVVGVTQVAVIEVAEDKLERVTQLHLALSQSFGVLGSNEKIGDKLASQVLQEKVSSLLSSPPYVKQEEDSSEEGSILTTPIQGISTTLEAALEASFEVSSGDSHELINNYSQKGAFNPDEVNQQLLALLHSSDLFTSNSREIDMGTDISDEEQVIGALYSASLSLLSPEQQDQVLARLHASVGANGKSLLDAIEGLPSRIEYQFTKRIRTGAETDRVVPPVPNELALKSGNHQVLTKHFGLSTSQATSIQDGLGSVRIDDPMAISRPSTPRSVVPEASAGMSRVANQANQAPRTHANVIFAARDLGLDNPYAISQELLAARSPSDQKQILEAHLSDITDPQKRNDAYKLIFDAYVDDSLKSQSDSYFMIQNTVFEQNVRPNLRTPNSDFVAKQFKIGKETEMNPWNHALELHKNDGDIGSQRNTFQSLSSRLQDRGLQSKAFGSLIEVYAFTYGRKPTAIVGR